ncbi:hypothetical protein AAFF_G00276720 [Aldrovandia affinis]|uniref:G-protein coupled receptors family 1 profile domain-containing protein n=1 Tax=Aldrovandia affinis TaxID=143900 RepID=A0AAD7RAP5_9TELE|nr:hypothetical protein AAFF_G00276720 [Aldrovandia affinis]
MPSGVRQGESSHTGAQRRNQVNFIASGICRRARGFDFLPSWESPFPSSNRSSSPAPEGVSLARSLALSGMLLMALLAAAGNAAVMAVIVRAPQLRKLAFVFHLCLVDLLAALVLMPLGMLAGRWAPLGDGDAFCRGYLCLSVGLVTASILSVSAINVERYYYVVHPLRHEVRMTLGLAAAVLVGIWVKASVMSALPLLGWTFQQGAAGWSREAPPPWRSRATTDAARCTGRAAAVLGGSGRGGGGSANRVAFTVLFALLYFVCPLLIILVVYCNMFRWRAWPPCGRPGPRPPPWTRPRRDGGAPTRSAAARRRRPARRGGGAGPRVNTPQRSFRGAGGKAAGVLAAVGGQFLCCWLPYFSFHLYSALSASPPASLAQLEEVVTWIGYSCFTSNPFFYGCLNRQIREELGKRFPCLFRWAGPVEDDPLPSREASIEENFLQFLQGTGCSLEPRDSRGTPSPKAEHSPPPATAQPPQAPPQRPPTPVDFRIPGQILEETTELMEQHNLNSDLTRAGNCIKTLTPTKPGV